MSMKALIIAAFAMTLIVIPPQSHAWVSKKRYAETVASWPAEGPRPSEQTAQAVALAYFNQTLKDPYSAKYEWGSIEQGTVRGAFERFGATGWILTVGVNARNSYGAYIGITAYKLVMRSGSIIRAYRYDSRMHDWAGEAPPLSVLPTSAPPSAEPSAPQSPCVACAKIGGG